jgi:hypothetical protein
MMQVTRAPCSPALFRYLVGACNREVAARVCSCDIYTFNSTMMIPFNPAKVTPQTEQVRRRAAAYRRRLTPRRNTPIFSEDF